MRKLFECLSYGVLWAAVGLGSSCRPASESTGVTTHLKNGNSQNGHLKSGTSLPDSHPGPVGKDAGASGELEFAAERQLLVEQLSSPANDVPVRDKRVLDALLRVPRHEFVPKELRDQSYQNTPLPIGENQTISQPYIVGLMTQCLELKGTEKVLEVGTGSGYQAAILGELAAEVYTVEIRSALHEAARNKLADLKARGLIHSKKIETVLGDGSKGYAAAAPYDAIIVTAAPSKVPVELLNQLKPGGRLVIPVGDYFQELQLIRKKEDGTYLEEPIVPVRFVPLLQGKDSGSGPR